MRPFLANPELEPRDTDAVVWNFGFVIAPYGSRIGVRSTSASLLAEARSRILADWVEISEPEVDHLWSLTEERAYFDSQPFAGEPVEELDHFFHLYMGVSAVGYTFIHAGAVVYEGQGILLPGHSFAGKSTLTLALHGAGAGIYSDDLAVLDRNGLLHPYPKPLSQRMPDGRVKEIPVPGWRPKLPGVPVKLIANLRFDPECSDLSLERLPAGQASVLLIENCLTDSARFVEDFQTVTRVSTTATSYRGVRGESKPAAAVLLNLLGPGFPPAGQAEKIVE